MKLIHRLLVFVFICCGIFLTVYFSVNYFYQKQEDLDMKIVENTVTEGKPIDIAEVILPKELKTEEYGDIFYYDGQIKRQVTYRYNPISQLNFSSTTDKFGYFVNYNIYDENISDNKEVTLRIEDINTRDSKQVYSGSFRTSGWEWFSNDEVLVNEGCGTECHVQILENLITEKEYVLQYGVGYTWSPNKKWVFAYNYSYRTGITIGDKFGNVIYKHHILPPENEMANTPLAVWSPDSSKLAFAMKKSDDKSFELFILDSGENFKEIFKSNVGTAKKFELKWAPDGKTLNINDQKIILK